MPEQTRRWQRDDIEIAVTRKPVKHLRLVVHPDGRVRASVPRQTSDAQVDAFLQARLDWVRQQQQRLSNRHLSLQSLTDGSTVRLWGDSIRLRIVIGRSRTHLDGNVLTISVAEPADYRTIAAKLTDFYRREIKAVLPDLIAKWGTALGRQPSRVSLRVMRTRWGSCTPTSGAIRLNPDLAAFHPHCLSYVVLHELVHLVEAGHGLAFQSLMDSHLANWRSIRAELRSTGFRLERPSS